MHDRAEDLVVRLDSEAVAQVLGTPSRSLSSPSISLPDCPPDSPITSEWNYYRRIIGRLLTDGQEGKWLLIKNEAIIGIWDTQAEADAVRLELFPMQPVLMKQILAREPILRIGYNRLCRS